MKKKILAIAVILMANELISQPYYGEGLHDQGSNYELTTGSRVLLGQNGFVLGGVKTPGAMGLPNFVLNKLGPDGSANTGTNNFFSAYQVSVNSACSPNPQQALNCAGISAIPFTFGPLIKYALAGAVDEGCFYLSLDANGNWINKAFFSFPANSSQPSKPIILTRNFAMYIVGSFISTQLNSRQMYILKVNPAGSIIQNVTFNMGAVCQNQQQCPCSLYGTPGGYDITPNDAIFSPFGAGDELVIVGEAVKYGLWGPSCTPNSESSGFLVKLDAQLNPTSSDLFDHNTGLDGFTSVAATDITVPGNEGFVVGGYSDFNLASGRSWMIKIDDSNSMPLWSSLLNSTWGNNSTFVTDVAYRNSPTYGDTYFGVLSPASGGLVVKLDANGSAFTSTNTTDDVNEFNYLGGSNSTVNSKLISINPAAGQNNYGIQVYGNGNGNEFFMGLATFNGVTNFNGATPCTASSNSNLLQNTQGPSNKHHRALNPMPPGLLVSCNNFNVNVTTINPNSSLPCQQNGLPVGGSNNKAVNLIEGPASEIESEFLIDISPNPSDGIFKVTNFQENKILNIRIFDTNGRLVFSKTTQAQAEHLIDVAALQPALYFVEIQGSDNKVVRRKLVKE